MIDKNQIPIAYWDEEIEESPMDKDIPIVFVENGVKKTETIGEFFSKRPFYHVNKHPTKKFLKIITAYSAAMEEVDGATVFKNSTIVICTNEYWKLAKPIIKKLYKGVK